MLVLSVLAPFSSYGAGPTDRDLALAYVATLPGTTKLYVWPSRLRVHEIVGRGDVANVADAVAGYASSHPEMTFWSFFPVPPLVSIYAYDEEVADSWEEFAATSKLPGSFKEFLSTYELDKQACAFVGLVSRDTWATGGVVFVDRSRLSVNEQQECVAAGLDYINGFPTAPRFDYREFPSADVRRLVLGAVLKCSAEGRFVEGAEVTKDGFTPLPSLECVQKTLKD